MELFVQMRMNSMEISPIFGIYVLRWYLFARHSIVEYKCNMELSSEGGVVWLLWFIVYESSKLLKIIDTIQLTKPKNDKNYDFVEIIWTILHKIAFLFCIQNRFFLSSKNECKNKWH